MRKEIDIALKNTVIPKLRELGFKGRYPNFYRDEDNHIDLLYFQFYSSGGKFVCEISFADQKRDNVFFKKETPVSKLRVNQTNERLRLGSSPKSGINDYWFEFEKTSILSRNSPQNAADSVLNYLNQASEWWALHKNL